MKKLLLVCAFVFGVSAVSFAQDQTAQGGQGRGRRNPAQMTERLKKQLTLNDDQVAKVTAIYAAQVKVQDSLRTANAGGDRAAIRPAQQALRKATTEKILAILTPDQATIYKKQLADIAARQQQNSNGNGN
ncbi:hypothetical protein [Mucilaginibacter sp. UR6-11]|uniref:hypothetical protein n=1 Tax=Mucilaginibacter sp. UR6-11 TaxID=1435644 RepID=UPI001E2F7F0D|nr:hypothetical protein [Mucilaginibacter sp. UR6-11]MCC8425845.1 hypothetical protein [Mucilaginibacter sp. UR6-11]